MPVKNKLNTLETVKVGDFELVIEGKFFYTISVKEEWDNDVHEPQVVIDGIKAQKFSADLFTFRQRLPQIDPVFDYRMELDNVAAIPVSTYEHWWTKQANQEVRNKVRKSIKKGVMVRLVEFSDDLVHRIKEIYDETPIRQGKPFPDYQISFEEAKAGNATYLDRSDFLGAYLGDELIGFVKLAYTQNSARTMGILAKVAHRDKAPMNALIAKAVEICAQKRIPYFVYATFIYGSKGVDSLAHFKLENGFQKYDLPRYYVPLSARGRIYLALNLQKSRKGILPRRLAKWMLEQRRRFYRTRYGSKKEPAKS